MIKAIHEINLYESSEERFITLLREGLKRKTPTKILEWHQKQRFEKRNADLNKLKQYYYKGLSTRETAALTGKSRSYIQVAFRDIKNMEEAQND